MLRCEKQRQTDRVNGEEEGEEVEAGGEGEGEEKKDCGRVSTNISAQLQCWFESHYCRASVFIH